MRFVLLSGNFLGGLKSSRVVLALVNSVDAAAKLLGATPSPNPSLVSQGRYMDSSASRFPELFIISQEKHE